MNAVTQAIVDGLRAQRIEVSMIGTSLNLSRGTKLHAHRSNIELDVLDMPSTTDRPWIQGFSRGVAAVLAEPPRSNANTWPFERAAGRLLPSLEHPAFALGVEAASSEPAFTWEMCQDTIVAYTMELDRGSRAVTRPQIERWGVTIDRVKSAARSLLFHRTQGLRWTHEGQVYSLRRGDGYDAARVLVFEDAYFTELREPPAVAMPSSEQLFFVLDHDPSSLGDLERAASIAYQEAKCPLSNAIYRLESGLPVPFS